MTSESVRARTADADFFLPADGLSLLGEHHASGHGGRQFLVGRSDGQVIQLPLLLYLIMAAIAEGGVDGGWSADQVGARVGAASGQGLTADNVRYLVAGKLAPLGLIAAGGADRRDGADRADRLDRANRAGPSDRVPGAERPPRVNLLPEPEVPGPGLRRRVAGAIGRVLGWPGAGRVAPLRPRYRRRRWALALGAAAALVSVAAAAPIMAGTGGRGTGRTSPAAALTAAAASASASAIQSQAAAWVAQQVSRDVTVTCDPGLCRLLQRDGFPAARLKPLPPGAHGPLSSGVVVATPDIRDQLGPRLAAAYAPQVIASFGSGVTQVAVRTVAPDGAAAFLARLATETTALASVGRQLTGNKNIQASPATRSALRAGRVDARLLSILALLSTQMPVRLASFTSAPGADPGAPLRAAEITVGSPAPAVLALLDAQQGPYRPAAAVAGGGRQTTIDLQFDAPAALNMSQP